MQPRANISPRFHLAYSHIQRLEQYERYQAALIFGSLARKEATDASDMDVKEPLGGRQPIAENNCHCPVCQSDLARVLGA